MVGIDRRETTLAKSFRRAFHALIVEKAFSQNYMAIDDKRDAKYAVDDQFHNSDGSSSREFTALITITITQTKQCSVECTTHSLHKYN